MSSNGMMNVDVVVVGSGAAGLTAALTAKLRGASVAIVEAEDVLGGTSAIGGGNLWIPGNGPMLRAGRADDPAEALVYLRRVSGPRPAIENARAFIEHGRRLVDFLETHSALRFSSIARHDYHADWDGAGFGRSLEPEPFEAGRHLGGRGAWFRTNPTRAPLTYSEYRTGPNPELVAERRQRDVRTQGAALIAGLGHAALTAGVDVLRGVGLARLERMNGAGFLVDLTDGNRFATRSVVLASGGFASNPAMRRALLPGVEFVSLAAGRAAGDGIRGGLDCGAGLFGIGDGWLGAVHVPEDGRAPFLVVRELALPGSMLVNGDGRRFVNEALGYNDVGRGMLAFDPARACYPAARSWLIFDDAFRLRYPVLGTPPGAPVPANWHQADSIADLSNALMFPERELASSVEQMNYVAKSGHDYRFGRGSDAHQRFNGDAGHEPNPCLGTISQAPFYAAPIVPGLCGTKGGLAVNEQARVLDRDGAPISGLYACGDVAASVMGFGYAGAGASIGPAMTFAMLAGEAIV